MNATTATYGYDAADQVQGWAYDAAGNLTSDGATTYSYDALNELTGTSAISATRTYAYNGDGTLVSQVAGGTTTRYAQDLAAGQAQVLAATSGSATADFLYGDGAERLAAVSAGLRTWYGADAQGSVRQTLDDNANVLAYQNYDPYGQPETAARPSQYFGYTGELQDPTTGNVNLRARWYQPGYAALLGVDPALSQTEQPYSYVGDNSINYRDPSGLRRFVIWAAAFIADKYIYFPYPHVANEDLPLAHSAFAVTTVAVGRYHGDNRTFTTDGEQILSSRMWNQVIIDDDPTAQHRVVGNYRGTFPSAVDFGDGVFGLGGLVGDTRTARSQAPAPAFASVTTDFVQTTIHIRAKAADPLVAISPAILANWDITFDPLSETIHVHGSHSAYPWFELWISGIGAATDYDPHSEIRYPTPFDIYRGASVSFDQTFTIPGEAASPRLPGVKLAALLNRSCGVTAASVVTLS